MIISAKISMVSSGGTGALPVIRETLEDAAADRERVKASIKAAGILGQNSAPGAEIASVVK